MASRATQGQFRLFEEPQADLFAAEAPEVEAAFVEQKRGETAAMLALAEGAERLPWSIKDAILADRRFKSAAGWLPEAEGERLRARFDIELDRLWAIEDRIARSG